MNPKIRTIKLKINKLKKITALPVFFIIAFIFLKSPLYASKPVVGVVGVKSGSVRLASVSGMFENQLINIINSSGIFSILNPELLKDQLTRYKCVDEECLLAFAETAKINLIISAFIEDKGNSIIYNIQAQGINAPYYGKIVYKYSAEIPLSGLNISTVEYEYISEEHAAYFVSGLLKKYKAQYFIKSADSTAVINSDETVNGTFDLYRYDNTISNQQNIRLYNRAGKVDIKDKEVKALSKDTSINDNDFIFITFTKKAEFIENFFYGRKREMVFNEKSLADTTVLLFSTIPASALMPLIAPLGYHRNGDYTGLGLWAINSLPYLYIEYKGLTNRPESYRDDNRDISRLTATNYYFGLYMLFCGGMPLMVDAFSSRNIYLASSYQGKQPYMGNTMSAVYLSLISGGGGMFYKGYRPEGYLFFHLHNILLYMAIKELCADETYHRDTNSYSKASINKKKAYTYLGALGLLKVIEITRVILVKDNICNGKLLEENYGFEPAVYNDENGLNFGVQYTVRY